MSTMHSTHSTFLVLEMWTILNSSASSAIYGDSISLEAKILSVKGNVGWASKGGGITCVNCAEFRLAHGCLEDLKADLGGAIYLEQTDAVKVGAE